MKTSTNCLIGCFIAASVLPLNLPASDQIPGAKQKGPIAIVGGTLHTVSGDVIANGTIVFEDGKVTALGSDVEVPKDAQVIEGKGKHIYPGLIESHSDIGLVEINSVDETIDSRESGSINSNVQAMMAFNPDSELIPVARANGVLTAVSAPEGGLLSGRSALMSLDGWTREDMTVKADSGMHLRWPRSGETVRELEQFFDQSRRYLAARKAGGSEQPRDLRLEGMAGVFDKSVPLIVDASNLEDLRAAIAFKRRNDVKMIIAGGTDAVKVAEMLKSENVPVIVKAVYANPSRRHSAYDEAYTLPKRLHEAGITFAISAGGRFGANGLRNLPYNAATAVAYGLSEDQALRSITLTPAEILGVSERIGSLQVGLDATLFIADGDILETPTQVESAFIQGRTVDLNSRHTLLYKKYQEKYKQLSSQ